MCFTNYTLTSEDMDRVGSEHDVNEIYEYKRQKYADELYYRRDKINLNIILNYF